MIDLLGQIAWYGSLLGGPLVFALVLYRLGGLPVGRRFAAAACFGIATFLVLFILGISVLFRDGLAPGLVPSHGLTAVTRTGEGLAKLLIAAPFGIVGWLLSRRSERLNGSQNAAG